MSNKINFLKSKKVFIILIAGLVVLSGVIFAGIKVMQKMNKVTTCIVQFESSGGTKINIQEVEKGMQIIEPEPPTKEGFTFVEWQLNGETFDFNGLVTENIILTAKWEANPDTVVCRVIFNSDGGSRVNSIEVVQGGTITPPINPVKKGYVFAGWYLNNEKYNFENHINNDILLKAKWIENKETLNQKEINNSSTDNEIEFNNTNSMDNGIEISKEVYKYEKKDINTEYGGEIPEMHFGYKESTQLYSYFGFWSYDFDTCKIIYRTDNPDILKVNSDGIATGIKLGKTNLYICLVDKKTNQEIDCFTWHASVIYQPGTNASKQDGENLLNLLNGYYWYLDGYKYAYIKGDVIPWYDHKALSWDSQHIEIENNAFVTSEQTGKNYQYSSSTIHNKFLVNPTEFAYSLIEDYNMRVEGDKLYISLGGKTYTFTKHYSKKPIIGNLSLNKTTISLNENDNDNSVVATIYPAFAESNLEILPSNLSIVNCWIENSSNGSYRICCNALKEGNVTIKVIDTISGESKSFNVIVTHKNINIIGITLNKSRISINKGSSETLYATISPNNATNKNVFWNSSNNNVATVDSSGKITAVGIGTAIITVTTEDGGYTATCNVTVNIPPLKVDGSIGFSTIFTSTGMVSGMFVEAKPSGGTGDYTYNLKLYYEGVLIGEGTEKELFVNQTSNGTYSATITVVDSNGTSETITKTITKS